MKQYTLLTANGINKLLKTTSDGSKIALKEVVVSDYDGELSEQTTSIPNEKYRGAINAVTIDENDNNILDVDAIIPPEVGGFYIKTAGIYCDDGSLFAVARLADTYKPLLNEGSSKDITLNFKLQIANASESIILKVDNNIVLATRKWCEKMFLKIKDKIDAYTKKESDDKFALKDDLPPLATETKTGIVKIKNIINAKQTDAAVTEKAVSDLVEANKGLGVDQTWQDMKSQRQNGVIYTNTTGRAIMILVSQQQSSSSQTCELEINGKRVLKNVSYGTADGCIISALIPAGATYKVIYKNYPPLEWQELR